MYISALSNGGWPGPHVHTQEQVRKSDATYLRLWNLGIWKIPGSNTVPDSLWDPWGHWEEVGGTGERGLGRRLPKPGFRQ